MLASLVAVLLLLGGMLAGGDDRPAEQTAVAETETAPSGPPTPYFASYRSLRLSLPVPPDKVTVVAFHQAAGKRALHLEPLVPIADMEAVAKRVNDGDFVTSAQLAEENGSASDASSIWDGEALQLWRSGRTGPPDTAVDVGALPGTEVRSPVSGKVIAVRPYDLYGSVQDFEIHIQPDGWPEVDVVLIHVTDVLVSEGETVVGGVTRIASVRALAREIGPLQISGYVADEGDHVHVQLNELPDPAMMEYIGDS
ncbi:MAG: hypothetical protein Kow0056_08560 [Coriobacteriia bacterium]